MTFSQNTNEFDIQDICDVASYKDANDIKERLFRKLAFYLVVFAAVLITVLGSVTSILTMTTTKTTQVSGHAVILNASNISANNEQTPSVTPEPKITVIVDAGHGGFDPGTQGVESGIKESEVNLSVAKKLEELLIEAGYNVIMTRTNSEALGASKEDDMLYRDTLIQSSDANIFISIHQNAYEDSTVCGPEVYYHPTKPMAKELADCVEKQIASIDGIAASRGVREFAHRLTKFLDYSVLIECGFLTSPSEEAKLVSEEYQYVLAKAITDGINDFCKIKYSE